ncbi:MAG: hypothetical protein ABL932_16020, partial [Terricaulis sp.]
HVTASAGVLAKWAHAPSMNVLLIISSIAGFGSAIGHSYLSERFVLGPLLSTPGDNRIWRAPFNHRLMRAMWHLPSFAWAQIAAATLWVVFNPEAFDAQATALLAYFGVGTRSLPRSTRCACRSCTSATSCSA